MNDGTRPEWLNRWLDSPFFRDESSRVDLAAYIRQLEADKRALEADRTKLRQLLDCREIYVGDGDDLVTRVDEFIDDYYLLKSEILPTAVKELLESRIAELSAENKQLAEDRARLDWLCEGERFFCGEHEGPRQDLYYCCVAHWYVPTGTCETLRQAIDAAREAQLKAGRG